MPVRKARNGYVECPNCGTAIKASAFDTEGCWECHRRKNKKTAKKPKPPQLEKCPECGKHALKYENGCSLCTECGYSRCDT